MGDVTTLLREAVPIEEVEPDLDAVGARVRRRRRRRVVARAAGCVALAFLVGGGSVALRDDDRPAVSVTAGEAGDASANARAAYGVAPSHDASEFVRLLSSRPWLAEVRWRAWQTTPEEFAEVGHVPGDAVVVGTLQEVRAGESATDFCMYVQDCRIDRHLDTVVRVEQVLTGSIAVGSDVVVQWKLDSIVLPASTPIAAIDPSADPAVVASLQAAAPIGARVMVFLDLSDEGTTWRPVEPSGIVIEDPDGVAITQPGPEAPDLAMAFDDYLAGVQAVLRPGG